MTEAKRPRRRFTAEFKKQLVQLYASGKPRAEIIREYELTPSAFDKWVRQYQTSGAFTEKENRTPEQEELIRLRKENQKLAMENDIFKASGADHGTKIDVIRQNRGIYPVAAMCAILNIPRSTFYYEAKQRDHEEEEEQLTALISDLFRQSRGIYGQRKIKKELTKQGWTVSRRRIGRIMKAQGLVSTYTVAQFKPTKFVCNESEIGNTLDRKFQQEKALTVVVSDLTYVRVGANWHYICIIIDLYNREIIGYSSGPNKNKELVGQAIAKIPYPLQKIALFHTDRGREFINQKMDQTLATFGIARSLSNKGTPYDNAVAEATFKAIKIEFVSRRVFPNQHELDLALFDYVHWFNHIRLHGSLDYQSPVDYKALHL
ncbi:IS3 family transposase [Shouchella clausii]|nr:IS3 family transposase [Shouchella clausii]QNM45298.1 IS3 family transposase [Shouchella clausii]